MRRQREADHYGQPKQQVEDTPLFSGIAAERPAYSVQTVTFQAKKEGTPPETIADRFAVFDAEHPMVWECVERMALHQASTGVQRIGVKFIVESVRLSLKVSVNNTFTAEYARKLVAVHPEMADLIETRKLKRSA